MQQVLKILNSIKSKAPNNRKLCVMITLGISNALIRLAFKDMGVPLYLRRIISDYPSQESVLVGRDTRYANVMWSAERRYLGTSPVEYILQSCAFKEVPTGTTIIVFADETTVICNSKSQLERVSNTNWVLAKLSSEIRKNCLKRAADKAKALILYGVFDHNCEMKEHVVACGIKSAKSVMVLSRIMPNLGGPKSSNWKS
ncbi:hypothetical protein HUJ04_007004 [Dendroctonus ponderosae]|nr:hypothetical protein HUJ04_007004 [Dendroctonus ponderosae]